MLVPSDCAASTSGSILPSFALGRCRNHNVFRAGKGEGLRLWSYAAGHTIGGAVWRIAAHGEDIVYAVDFNHRKERHLNGAAIDSVFSRPAILITGAWGRHRPDGMRQSM